MKNKRKIVCCNWHSEDEIKGGTEVISSELKNFLKAEVISTQKVAKTLGYKFGKYYQYAIVDRGLQFGEYLQAYKNFNGFDFLIKNSAIDFSNKIDKDVITIFQDPYKDISSFMFNNQLCNKSYHLEFGNAYPYLQKQSSLCSFNVAVSSYMKKYMEENGIECHKVITHAINPKTFKPGKKNKKIMSLAKGYKKVCMWVGMFHPLKYTFISELINKNKDIFWILVAKDEEIRYIPKNDNVLIVNNAPRDLMPSIYNCCDFFVSTSSIEAFNLSAIEAMMCNKPVIVFKTGAFYDIELKSSIIIDDYKLEKYQEAIEKIISEKPKESPRKEAMSLFDYNKWKKEWQKVIKEAERYFIKRERKWNRMQLKNQK